MAPLLGRKPYPLAKPLAEPPGPGEEEVYIIEHSKEAFRNKEEYEARLQRYDERIWTCKSTGSSQLTHKEAWEEEQEVTELLQEEYPKWFEKPVLEIVHHNTVSLDKLVEKAWLEILTKYAVDEECDFLVGKDKSLQVKVVKIHPLENPEGEAVEKKLEGACDSPSSDKENASQENQRKEPPPREEENRRESLSDRARRSPRKLPTAMKEERKKWVMPKFLPHKYDVKLISEDKVISDVPTDSLYRTERPPTKEIMRYFIRHYALRLGMGESAPWVVEDELVKKFNLPSKFSDFLLDPHKFLAENPSAKRRSLLSPDGKPSKRLKTSDTPGEDLGNEKGERKRKRKKDSLGMPLSPTIWGHMQKMNGSPLKVKNSGTPKKGEGSAPSTPKSGRKSGDKKEGKRAGKSSDKKLNVFKAGAKTPKMKQMTLLHLAKSTPAGSPKKRARSTGLGTPKLGKPLHPMALHLLRYYKEHKGKEDKRNSLSSLISKAAKTLSPDDRNRLPEELKELVQKRWELLEQKKRWAAMSEEERQEEMKKRREEVKEKLREKAKERREKEMLVRREQSRRYEDQEIEGGKALPTFKLVDMPEGLPNTLFGDVAMVVDFLHCYAGLLMPDDQYPITSVALMEALAGERSGFLYLNRVLVVLLQTLLQDELAEGYSELDMPLSEIPLTMHSVSELARLCLRPCDAHGEESGQGSVDSGALGGFDDVVTSEFLEKLETIEVFELGPEEKTSLLVALCHRILMTYSVEDHVDAMQQRSAEVWKERLAMLKEVNDRKRAEKLMKKEMEGKGEKKKEGSAKKESKKEVKVEPEPEPEDMISSVKSRRLMSMQAKKEKEEMDRQNKERMEKEAEEERMRKQRAAVERAFQDGITKARLVTRRAALGTDRNHNRYWLFSDVVPGLYIEKGWVHESIDYSFTPPPEEKPAEDKPAEPEVEEEEDAESAATLDSQGAEKDDGSIDGAISEGAQQGAAADICIETTIPNQGQNLWFVCESTAELEELVESLHPQGVRESELKAKIQSRYQDILHSVHLTRKGKLGLRTCDGYEELLNYLRSDIQEVASRLQKGGLGYLDDNVDIEEQLKDMESLKDFGEVIITIQACVIKKFLQGFMAPKQKKKKKQGGEESSKAEEVDEEKRLAEEARVATAVEKWKTAIREAQTFSRMHVLLGMLDACIKWDMSAENARCKVCRRKGDDEKLILCDECNKAFHLFCLRPALYRIPTGEWLCPACQPTVARRGSRSRNYNQDTDEEEDEEESEEEESEEEEEDEEENDYTAMGHSLRPRKKNKQSSSRFDCVKDRGYCNPGHIQYCRDHYANSHCEQGCDSAPCGWDGSDCFTHQSPLWAKGTLVVHANLPQQRGAFSNSSLLWALSVLLQSPLKLRGSAPFPTNNNLFDFNAQQLENLPAQASAADSDGSVLFLQVDNRPCTRVPFTCFHYATEAASFLRAVMLLKPGWFSTLPELKAVVSIRGYRDEIGSREEEAVKEEVKEPTPAWLWAVIAVAIGLLLVLGLVVFLVVRRVRQQRAERDGGSRLRHRSTVTDNDPKSKALTPHAAHQEQRVRSSREKEKISLRKKKKAKEAEKKRRREPLGEDAIRMRPLKRDQDIGSDTDFTQSSMEDINARCSRRQEDASICDHRSQEQKHYRAGTSQPRRPVQPPPRGWERNAMPPPLLSPPQQSAEWCGPDGSVVLIRAVRSGLDRVVLELLRAGVPVNNTDHTGRSALHWACSVNHLSLTRTLIRYGAAVDLQDNKGETALFLSAIHGCYDTARLLLLHGANLELHDRRGRRPMDAAREGIHHQVLELLLAHQIQRGPVPVDSANDMMWEERALMYSPWVGSQGLPGRSASFSGIIGHRDMTPPPQNDWSMSRVQYPSPQNWRPQLNQSATALVPPRVMGRSPRPISTLQEVTSEDEDRDRHQEVPRAATPHFLSPQPAPRQRSFSCTQHALQRRSGGHQPEPNYVIVTDRTANEPIERVVVLPPTDAAVQSDRQPAVHGDHPSRAEQVAVSSANSEQKSRGERLNNAPDSTQTAL